MLHILNFSKIKILNEVIINLRTLKVIVIFFFSFTHSSLNRFWNAKEEPEWIDA